MSVSPVGGGPAERAWSAAILAAIAGTIGVVGGWVPFFGLGVAWMGPVAIGVSWMAWRALPWVPLAEQRRIRAAALIGTVTGVIATVFFLVWIVAAVIAVLASGDPFQGL